MIPFAEGLPEHESVVEVDKSFALGAKEEELSDKYFMDSSIKSGASIKEECENRLVVDVDRLVNNFREKESSHLVAHAGAKELDISSGVVPVTKREVPDVGVQALSGEGAGADSPVT